MIVDLLLFSLDFEFMKALVAGARHRAGSLGVDVRVHDGSNSTSIQLDQIHEAVRAGTDALIVSPNDSNALVPAVLTANRAQIPLVTVDGIIMCGTVDAHVGFKNAAGGAMAAQYLVCRLPPDAHVLHLQGTLSEFHAQQRSIGFEREMRRRRHMHVTSIGAQWRTDQAYGATLEALAAYPNLRGIFAHNDEMIGGALQALEAHRRGGEQEDGDRVITVAIDCNSATVERIRMARQDASIQQDPIAMGAAAVHTACAIVKGHKFSELNQLRPVLVTTANVDDQSLWTHALPQMVAMQAV